MIRLKKDSLVMEVCTDLQASVFERNGYVRIEDGNGIEMPEPIIEEQKPSEPVAEQPKRRRRKATVETTE